MALAERWHRQGAHGHGFQDRAHWESVLRDAQTAERATAHAVNMARRHLVRKRFIQARDVCKQDIWRRLHANLKR